MIINLKNSSHSDFFCTSPEYKSLMLLVAHKMRTKGPAGIVRFWNPDCGAGESAYSLAILCESLRKSSELTSRFSIRASDASQLAIDQAIEGRFGRNAVQTGLTKDELEAWFFKTSDTNAEQTWLADKQLQAALAFDVADLGQAGHSEEKYDVIVWRAYLEKLNKAELLARLTVLAGCLEKDGYLVLANGEALNDDESEFYPLSFGQSILYQFDRSIKRVEALNRATGA